MERRRDHTQFLRACSRPEDVHLHGTVFLQHRSSACRDAFNAALQNFSWHPRTTPSNTKKPPAECVPISLLQLPCHLPALPFTTLKATYKTEL